MFQEKNFWGHSFLKTLKANAKKTVHFQTFCKKEKVIFLPISIILRLIPIKDIFQPFELGGVTRLIRSAVKFCKASHKNFFFNDTILREELKTN
jgi:hypothetical protein